VAVAVQQPSQQLHRRQAKSTCCSTGAPAEQQRRDLPGVLRHTTLLCSRQSLWGRPIACEVVSRRCVTRLWLTPLQARWFSQPMPLAWLLFLTGMRGLVAFG